MRTTVTLDPDVERLIRDAMRERAISFKEALNEAARNGLRGKEHKRARKFIQKSFRMGAAQEFRWDKALAVADAIEDEELTRKLTLRK
jgi:cytochrome P450